MDSAPLRDATRLSAWLAGWRAHSPPFSQPRIGSQAGPGLIHGVAERLTELVDHRRRNVELTLRIGLHLIASSFIGRALVLHFFLEHADAVDETLRTGRTSGHININRNDGIDPLHHLIVVEHSTGRCTSAHGYAPLRLWHLLPDSPNDRSELERNAPGADQNV